MSVPHHTNLPLTVPYLIRVSRTSSTWIIPVLYHKNTIQTEHSVLHSLLLKAHELFPDGDESLGEVWDVLDPLHQLADHLR